MNCRFHNVPPPCPDCSTDGYIVTGDDNKYYDFHGATCFADLVEQRSMGFNRGNILKSVLRWDEKPNLEYNLKKIIWYANRELLQVQKAKEGGA